jgi:hypothetical protein
MVEEVDGVGVHKRELLCGGILAAIVPETGQ